jgi:uncharacterized protein (TIGR02466 family)
MTIVRLFPTQVWIAKLAVPAGLNRQLLREGAIFRKLDDAGRAWSKENYPAGYTSYSSIQDLPERSTTFERLRALIDREVTRYARALDMDLRGRRLVMTTCWLNAMGRGAQHSAHIHPLAAISGTYYVRVPRGASSLKLEDPRLACFMGSPPRQARARDENRRWIEFAPAAGSVILFESWLKHEVPPNRSREERVSVSFNYEWS